MCHLKKQKSRSSENHQWAKEAQRRQDSKDTVDIVMDMSLQPGVLQVPE